MTNTMQASSFIQPQTAASQCCFPMFLPDHFTPTTSPKAKSTHNNSGNSLFGFFRPARMTNQESLAILQQQQEQQSQKLSSLPPPEDPKPETTDALIAQELNQLSIKDRNRIFEEIHGVDDDEVIEDPDFIEPMLEEMEKELLLQVLNSKSAFLQAKLQSPAYVSRRDLRLRFLRAESYSPNRAASRFAAFFEFKLELFGFDKLTRDIEVKHLLENPTDKKALESGLFQCLPGRDRSGRVVVGKFHRWQYAEIPVESKLRVFWYLLMAATEEDIDQKRGIIIVVFNMYKVVNRIETWKNTTLLRTLPVKLNAFHICHNDPTITALSSLATIAMGPNYRVRLRVFEGTTLECIYNLLTFGIASDLLPINAEQSDKIDVKDLMAWIQNRMQKESRQDDSSTPNGENGQIQAGIIVPTDLDVVFGRGKSSQNHSGNIRLRHMIDSRRSTYETAKVLEKKLYLLLLIK